MSYIHEALKKAQREKETSHHDYHGIGTAGGYKPTSLPGKSLVWLFFLLIVLAFTAYLWLPSIRLQPPDPSPVKPKGVPQPDKLAKAMALFKRARLFHKARRFQMAKQLYEETLSLDPTHIDALNNLGVLYMYDKNYAAAQGHFEKVIALKPDYEDPYYNLACLYALTGEVAQGLAYLNRAVSLDQIVKDWARTDTDLQNLHGLPAFEEIIGHHASDLSKS